MCVAELPPGEGPEDDYRRQCNELMRVWYTDHDPHQATIIELDMGKLEDALRRAETKLDEQDYAMLKALADSYAYLSELAGDT
jgi:hypothetical protein